MFRFVLLALTAFRLQRIVTTDEWAPSQGFRRYIDKRFGPESSWAELFSCPYCIGTWITLAVFAVAAQFMNIPDPVLQAVAASAIVGYIGVRED